MRTTQKLERLLSIAKEPLGVDILNRFSSWFKLKRAVALATKYVSILRTKVAQKRTSQESVASEKESSKSVLVEDLEQAEYTVLKNVQRHHFQAEITVLRKLKDGQFVNKTETRTRNQNLKRVSSIQRLDPFIDEHGIIRVGGRIRRADVTFEEKHTVILPKNSHVTTLIIRHYHETVQHQGRLLTLNEIRQAGYWIIQLRSDRGSNFIGAKGELSQAWNEMNQHQVQKFLLTKNCDWIQFDMNVPHSSHMGGVWERQIKTVRSVISALMAELGDQLGDETLRTLFTEAENVVNSRPLTAEFSDPDSPQPITPMQLLTLKAKVVSPPPGVFNRPDMYGRKRWKRVQFLANQFWQRWRREYLQNLQARRKWQSPRRNLQIGDIVIDKEGDLSRNQWPLARVTKTYPSDDGFVRKVEIEKATQDMDKNGRRKNSLNVYDQPIHKLVSVGGNG